MVKVRGNQYPTFLHPDVSGTWWGDEPPLLTHLAPPRMTKAVSYTTPYLWDRGTVGSWVSTPIWPQWSKMKCFTGLSEAMVVPSGASWDSISYLLLTAFPPFFNSPLLCRWFVQFPNKILILNPCLRVKFKIRHHSTNIYWAFSKLRAL